MAWGAGPGYNAARNAGRSAPVRSAPRIGRNAVPSWFRNLPSAQLPAPAPTPPPSPTTPTTPGPGQGQTAGTAPPPYDATYYAQLAGAQLTARNQINAATLQNTYLNNALPTAQAQLAQNQLQQTQNLQNAENARGGFAQGALGENVGLVARNTLAAQAANQNRLAQQNAQFQSAVSGIRSGLSVEQVALQMASRARQAALVASQPGTGSTGPPATTTTTTGGGGGKTSGGKTSGGKGKGSGKGKAPIRTNPINRAQRLGRRTI